MRGQPCLSYLLLHPFAIYGYSFDLLLTAHRFLANSLHVQLQPSEEQ